MVAILLGTFYLGPRETAMMELSGKPGLKALADPSYLYSQPMNLIFGKIQVLMLFVTVFISAVKPWKRNKIGTESRPGDLKTGFPSPDQ